MAKPCPSYSTSNTEEKKSIGDRPSRKSEFTETTPFALQSNTPTFQQAEEMDEQRKPTLSEGLSKIAVQTGLEPSNKTYMSAAGCSLEMTNLKLTKLDKNDVVIQPPEPLRIR